MFINLSEKDLEKFCFFVGVMLLRCSSSSAPVSILNLTLARLIQILA
jgi:hypothetical protein